MICLAGHSEDRDNAKHNERDELHQEKRRKYTAEFKANAVKLATQGDTTIAAVARDLGISEKSLYQWVSSAKQEATGGLTFEEREELVRLRREVRRLRQEREISKSIDPVREGRLVNYERIDALAQEHPVATVCATLGVSRSGYYAYRANGARRGLKHARSRRLNHAIRTAFDEHQGVYGRPRLQHVLRARGITIGTNWLRRRMAEMGLYAKPRRRFKVTTLSDHSRRAAPNLLKKDFDAPLPDRVWCSDITYVRTWQGWLYLCVVIDLCSRKIVGWSVADHMRATLVTDAFDHAVLRRRPSSGLIFHSDRGSQYAANELRRRLRRHGMRRSMSARGNCYDNVVVESFNDKLKQELIHRRPWPTKAAANLAIADYIERFYNPRRLHSTLGYVSPNQYEENLASVSVAA